MFLETKTPCMLGTNYSTDQVENISVILSPLLIGVLSLGQTLTQDHRGRDKCLTLNKDNWQDANRWTD